MKPFTWHRCFVRSAIVICATLASLLTPSWCAADDRLNSTLQLAQARQCERRAGPFATQDTAWRRWREARDRGLAVSRGVVPCYDQYHTRGYCFFVFYAC